MPILKTQDISLPFASVILSGHVLILGRRSLLKKAHSVTLLPKKRGIDASFCFFSPLYELVVLQKAKFFFQSLWCIIALGNRRIVDER